MKCFIEIFILPIFGLMSFLSCSQIDRRPPDTSPLPSSCYDKKNSLIFEDPAVLFMKNPDGRISGTYIFDMYGNDATGDTCIPQKLYPLDTEWDGINESILEKISESDSCILYKIRQDCLPDRFLVRFHALRTEISGDPNEVDDKTYLSGMYSMSVRMSDYGHNETDFSGKAHVKSPDGLIARLKIAFTGMKFNLSVGRHSQNNIVRTIMTDRKIHIGDALLYFLDSSNGTAFIFDGSILSSFDFDRMYCGDRNFYAIACEFGLDFRKSCIVLARDSTGILARLKPEYNKSVYRLYLTESDATDPVGYAYAAYIRIPDKKRKQKSSGISSSDYSEKTFRNAGRLIESVMTPQSKREQTPQHG